ncbi:MAG: glycosyltransferase family 4 protein, partial [Bacteroidetes bacterium]|nr:glycosyltransferase family 4 protein [Bacteroidota bacterium]
MSKIKVGIDIRDLHIAKTGARTYLEELIKALELHPDKNFNYILIDAKSSVYVGTNQFFKVIEHIKFFFWKQIILPIKAKIMGCKILICTDYFVPYFSLGIKTIPIFHDAFFYEYPTQYNKYWLFLFKNLAVKAAKKSVFVVTPTNYSKIQIAKHSSIPKDKIEVIYEASKSLSLNADKSIKDLQNSLQEKNYLLHVGTMEKRKNIPSLLKVFKKLKPEFPFLKLVLIGQFSPKSDMNDQMEIMKTIKNLDLKRDVVFPGYVSDDDLAVFYKDALAYVFPSVN